MVKVGSRVRVRPDNPVSANDVGTVTKVEGRTYWITFDKYQHLGECGLFLSDLIEETKPFQVGTLVRIKHDYYAPYTGKLATILEIDSNRGVAKIKLQDFDDAVYTLVDKLEQFTIQDLAKKANQLKVYRWYSPFTYKQVRLTAIGATPEQARKNGLEWVTKQHPEWLSFFNSEPEVLEEDASEYFDFDQDGD